MLVFTIIGTGLRLSTEDQQSAFTMPWWPELTVHHVRLDFGRTPMPAWISIRDVLKTHTIMLTHLALLHERREVVATCLGQLKHQNHARSHLHHNLSTQSHLMSSPAQNSTATILPRVSRLRLYWLAGRNTDHSDKAPPSHHDCPPPTSPAYVKHDRMRDWYAAAVAPPRQSPVRACVCGRHRLHCRSVSTCITAAKLRE